MPITSRDAIRQIRAKAEAAKKKRAARASKQDREVRKLLKDALLAACEGYPGIEVPPLSRSICGDLESLGFTCTRHSIDHSLSCALETAQARLDHELEVVRNLSVVRLADDILRDLSPVDFEHLSWVREFLLVLSQKNGAGFAWPSGKVWKMLPSRDDLSRTMDWIKTKIRSEERERRKLTKEYTKLNNAPSVEIAPDTDYRLLRTWIDEGKLTVRQANALWMAYQTQTKNGALDDSVRRQVGRDPVPLFLLLDEALNESNFASDRKKWIGHRLQRLTEGRALLNVCVEAVRRIQTQIGPLLASRRTLTQLERNICSLTSEISNQPLQPFTVVSWNDSMEKSAVEQLQIDGWSLKWISSPRGQRLLNGIDRTLRDAALSGDEELSIECEETTNAWAVRLPGAKRSNLCGIAAQTLALAIRAFDYPVSVKKRAGFTTLTVRL